VVTQKLEVDRLWDHVKASVVGLLLGWAGPVSLRVRDVDNRVVFSFNTSECKEIVQSNKSSVCKPRSAPLTSMLNVLTQASYIQVNQWSSWIPASASTSSLSIKGAISLDPAPTKAIQFISFGVHPLSSDAQHNELYDHVNRLFRLSTFGTIEDHVDFDHGRQKGEQIHHNSVYTTRHAKARKGVDRYPMFYLQIFPRGNLALALSDNDFSGNGMNIQTVVDVLGAVITQWLVMHHFRPVRNYVKHKIEECIPAAYIRPSSKDIAPSSSTFSTMATVLRKRKQSDLIAFRPPEQNSQAHAFAEWSRIKSGKAFFAKDVSRLPKFDPSDWPMSMHFNQTNSDNNMSLDPSGNAALPKPKMQPLAKGALSEAEQKQVPKVIATNNDELDKTILWVEAATKKAYTLNFRTGCAVPSTRPGFVTSPAVLTPAIPRTCPKAVLQLPSRNTTAERNQWLNGILQTWDNPVFKTSEQSIKQCIFEELQHGALGLCHPTHDQCSCNNRSTFNKIPPGIIHRLSKDSLSDAEVLAQVDKKFILVKIRQSFGHEQPFNDLKVLLVLIDQHAADERVQVEALFRNLCSPVAALCSGYQSRLGYSAGVASMFFEKPPRFTISSQERQHFVAYAKRFASWGILFDISEHITASERHGTSAEMDCILSVIALPPSISERCRADPELLAYFLRSAVWDYASNPVLSSHTLPDKDQDPPDWVARLAGCPKGLLDLINSRACRSAIMFNDELNLNQCRELVQKLASCVFPFMCAHGRPSITPLVDLGENEHGLGMADVRPDTNMVSFVKAWREWDR
jgi:DNA mismatch repair protein MLH3